MSNQGSLTARDIYDHATNRVRQRTTWDRETVARLWNHATPIDIDRTRLDGQAARYDPIHQVVMVYRDGMVRTVLLTDDPRPCVADELERSTDWERDIDPRRYL